VAWNGISARREGAGDLLVVHVFTDASGGFGCGAFVLDTQMWFPLPWPKSYGEAGIHLGEESITLKELLPIVMACAVWGREWEQSRVICHCDNQGVVALVNSGYSRVPQIMHLLRCLFFVRARFQVSLYAVHIPGRENTLADAISRNNIFPQVPGAIKLRSAARAYLPPGGATARLDVTSMDSTIQQLFSAGLAPSTQKSYQSGTRRYLAFCQTPHFLHVSVRPPTPRLCVSTGPLMGSSQLCHRPAYPGACRLRKL
jgi:hypothetical protein